MGGSTGVVAERLCRDFQFIGTVLELNGAEAKNSRERGLITVTAPLESFRVFIRYNVITVCQTIDHLLDIKAALEKLRGCIAADGLLFVDFVEDGPVKNDLPYYLTRETMARYLDRCGFRVVALVFFLGIVICNLFVIWNLRFGILDYEPLWL